MTFVVAAGGVLADPIVVGLVVGMPTTVLGVLGYRRAARTDRAAAHSVAVAAEGTKVQQVIEGLDRIADNLQADNATLRERLAKCNARVNELQGEG